MKIFFLIFWTIVNASGVALYTEGIVEKDLGLNPEQLVREYVTRDANGDFLGTNTWWNTAVACPACMGGPDSFTVISKYKIRKLKRLEFEVDYSIEGILDTQKFKPEKKHETVKYSVVKTKWGFKLDLKSYQMVRADVALKKYSKSMDESSIVKMRKIHVENKKN